MRSRRATLAAVVLVATACSEPAAAPERAAPDKAALFGDPSLVPSREGEAARRELASAGEIEAVLRASGWIDRVHVDVEHGEPIRVVIAGTRGATTPAELDEEIAAVVAGVLARDDAEIVLAIATPSEPPAPPRREVPLAFAAVGLGASVALAIDRALRRRRSRRRR
jgi:hypothetical protein